MNDEERQRLMQSFISSNEAEDKKRRAQEEERKKTQASAVKPAGSTGGSITIDGKSLGRVLAGTEERDGERFLNRNPEDVVIGKREDWSQDK